MQTIFALTGFALFMLSALGIICRISILLAAVAGFS